MLSFVLLVVVAMLSGAEIHGADLHHIVGGAPAVVCEFPHIVFVYIMKDTDNFQCGGSLIDDTHVLTAAHCVSGNVKRILILFGSLNVNKFTTSIAVSSYISHVGFQQKTKTVLDDVAVLKLSRPMKFNSCVKSIRMASPGEAFVGDCVIAGWGKTGGKLPTSNILLQATVPLVSQSTCDAVGAGATSQHICAGDIKRNGTTTCQGDSGGPLMCTSATDGDRVLAGVVSYGWTCTEGLAVFAKVSYFKNWIRSTADNM